MGLGYFDGGGEMKDSLITIVVIATFLGVPFLGWKITRWINYEFDYSSQVEKTINKMVKKECLRNN